LDDRFPATFPSGQGSDLAGVVTAVGPGVDTFGPGDEVLGWSDRRSSQAQFCLVPADHLVRKPAGLSFEAAGSLFVVGSTAYAAVHAVAAGPGDTVAVSGAAGGVGSIVVQLLGIGGSAVIGIASTANADWLASLGVTPVAYGDGLADRIRTAAPSGVDGFVDTFGGGYVALAVDELGVAPDRVETIIDFEAAARFGTRADGSAVGARTDVLAELAQLAAAGKLTIPIAAAYPLDQVAEAYAQLEQRHTRGKIVLIP
jgi:NADPH:quinone reductase-like Zn-dependent oxidoreductase